MKNIEIENYKYELIRNERDCFKLEEFQEKVTDYFFDFDYIFGDYAYDKLRLKGYYNEDSKCVKQINNITNLDNYIRDYCAYGASYFLLKKLN